MSPNIAVPESPRLQDYAPDCFGGERPTHLPVPADWRPKPGVVAYSAAWDSSPSTVQGAEGQLCISRRQCLAKTRMLFMQSSCGMPPV